MITSLRYDLSPFTTSVQLAFAFIMVSGEDALTCALAVNRTLATMTPVFSVVSPWG